MSRSEEVCARKQRYLSDADAKRAAWGLGMRYYRCSVCRRFHLTKMAAKKARFAAKEA